MAFGDEVSQIAHLLRRAGFGASPSELGAAVARGYDGTLDALLNPADSQDAADAVISQQALDLTRLDDLQRWWILRMRYSSRPLVEKMTLFWHGHFTSAVSKVGVKQLGLMQQQNDLFRSRGMGNFEDLLLDVSKDPAMLIWLDGRQNHKQAPNENYGRELMELFTMGIGNYTEDDVKAAARAFTGWSITKDLQFVFNAKDHDSSAKTFLGQTGTFDGTDIVHILVQQPATANFIAAKLARFFVADPPDPALVSDLAATFTRSGYDIKSVLRRLFKSDAFLGQAAYHALIKSPAEFVATMLRTLDVQTDAKGLPSAMRLMGQELFNPPNVAGWPGGTDWIATNTMLARDNLANSVSVASKPSSPLYVDLSALLNGSNATTGGALQTLAGLLVDGDLSSDEQTALLKYLGGDASAAFDVAKQDMKARGLLYLLLSMPEYSLN